MELYSLIPLPDDAASTFLRLVSTGGVSADGNTPGDLATRFWFARIAQNPRPRPNDLTFAFASWLSLTQPVFAHQGLSLSSWEARVDRGSGMLLRPPSRMFIDAGLDPADARKMPIRIEGGDGMMGGAFVPARLVGQYLERLDNNLERSVRRLDEAELDGPALMGLMIEAARYAEQHGTGVYEAADLLDPADSATWPPGVRVVTHTKDTALQERIRAATQPQKDPGVLARLFGRKRS